jgi:hypothetical protein
MVFLLIFNGLQMKFSESNLKIFVISIIVFIIIAIGEFAFDFNGVIPTVYSFALLYSITVLKTSRLFLGLLLGLAYFIVLALSIMVYVFWDY